jgi:hypothetical protein
MGAHLRSAPLHRARAHRILAQVKRGLSVIRRRVRVYYSLPALLFLLVAGGHATGQVGLTVNSAMTKGSATAPVTIVEFTDYQ